jgi:arylsulfatase A-like enzyme
MDPLMEKVEALPDKHLLSAKEFKAINLYLRKPPAETSDPERFDRLKGYREYWRARYEAGVAEADFYLGQLVQRLTEMGLWQDAYVVFLADHGEALCEHGLWDHGYSQYQTDLHVPLILRWPNVLPAGQRIGRLASLIDVMPTVLEQLGLKPGETLQGISLVDHISGRLPNRPLARFAEAIKAGNAQYAVFVSGTKLITTEVPARRLPDGTTSKPDAQHQLFNLATDYDEKYDLVDQHTELTVQMTKLLMRFLVANQNIKPGLAVSEAEVDRGTMDRLESLGYVGGDEEEEEEANAPQPESQPTSAPADE